LPCSTISASIAHSTASSGIEVSVGAYDCRVRSAANPKAPSVDAAGSAGEEEDDDEEGGGAAAIAVDIHWRSSEKVDRTNVGETLTSPLISS
tara:strand:+ start:236 stop:511 length:276 start_codon:yes stop_codon:yes gene_type:complete